jgi:RES domain-containing protein
VRIYRIYDHERPWARAQGFDPFDGEGAMHGSARWHHEGTRLAYAASNASLALLEILVHVNPADFGEKTLVVAEVPDDAVEEVSVTRLVQLLRDADDRARERASRDVGTAWAQEGRSLALSVPSLVVPHDRNMLLNPLHPRMAEVEEVARERVSLDPRLRLQRLEERAT